MRSPGLLTFALLTCNVLLTGCSESPSQLECQVWEESYLEAASFVNFWAQKSLSEMSFEDKKAAVQAQDLYLEVRRELLAAGCKEPELSGP